MPCSLGRGTKTLYITALNVPLVIKMHMISGEVGTKGGACNLVADCPPVGLTG